MNTTLIFLLVFIVQILGLSFLFPRFLLLNKIKAKKNLKINKSIIVRYELMNKVIIVFGFLLLTLLSFHPVFKSVVLTLLTIGLYFLLQVSPVIINKQLLEYSAIQQRHYYGAIKLTTVIHPFAIGIAIILFLLYLIKLFIEWDGSANTQLLQMAIFSSVNAFLVFILVFIYRKIKRTSGEEKQELIVGFSKSAPLFIYLSIGLSMYHFGKILIHNFDRNEFRPLMMSIALIVVGFAIFTTITPNNQIDDKSNEE